MWSVIAPTIKLKIVRLQHKSDNSVLPSIDDQQKL